MPVQKQLRDILLADAGVTALIGTRVYPLKAPQNPTEPFVTLNLVSEDPTTSLAGHSGLARTVVQLDTFDATYAGAWAVADAIRLAVQDYNGTLDGVFFQDVNVENARDDLNKFADGSEAPGTRVTQDVVIWWDQPAP